MNIWGIYFVLLHKVNLVPDLDVDLLFFLVVLMILGGWKHAKYTTKCLWIKMKNKMKPVLTKVVLNFI